MKLQVGVKVLLQNNKGEYLLIRRSQVLGDEQEPYWDIPGGRIEPEETLQDALKREIREETGLEIGDNPTLLAAQDIMRPAKDLHVVRLTYKVRGEGKVTISDEHQDVTWVTKENALELHLDPYLHEVMVQYV